MSPRVLVDATAVPADLGGVSRYVDGLVGGLDALGSDAAVRLAVVCQRPDEDHYARIAPHGDVVGAPAVVSHRAARLAWEQSGLPVVADRLAADVIHTPLATLPLRTRQPVVVTIHDIGLLSRPELRGSSRAGFERTAVRGALRRARRCVVPSVATKDELLRLLDADPNAVDVAPHGVDTAVFRPPDDEQRRHILHRLALPERGHAPHGRLNYIAFLGELSRRKNVPDLIRGYCLAVAGVDNPPALVLAGGDTWDDDVERAVAEVPIGLRVIRPGYLRAADLPAYLGCALVVVVPSETEGFGLPVLEAMASGTAVLAVRRLALPEVGGDAVAYTEPSAEAIGLSLGGLLADPRRRASLVLAGQERVGEFTWERSAKVHVESYLKALRR